MKLASRPPRAVTPVVETGDRVRGEAVRRTPDVRALARQAFRDTAAALQPELARERPAALVAALTTALMALACTDAGRALALWPLESMAPDDAAYVRRFRLLAREMIGLALTRASGSGLLKRCDTGLLARALVNDADFLGRTLAHLERRRARRLATFVFEQRLSTYLPGARAAA